MKKVISAGGETLYPFAKQKLMALKNAMKKTGRGIKKFQKTVVASTGETIGDFIVMVSFNKHGDSIKIVKLQSRSFYFALFKGDPYDTNDLIGASVFRLNIVDNPGGEEKYKYELTPVNGSMLRLLSNANSSEPKTYFYAIQVSGKKHKAYWTEPLKITNLFGENKVERTETGHWKGLDAVNNYLTTAIHTPPSARYRHDLQTSGIWEYAPLGMNSTLMDATAMVTAEDLDNWYNYDSPGNMVINAVLFGGCSQGLQVFSGTNPYYTNMAYGNYVIPYYEVTTDTWRSGSAPVSGWPWMHPPHCYRAVLANPLLNPDAFYFYRNFRMRMVMEEFVEDPAPYKYVAKKWVATPPPGHWQSVGITVEHDDFDCITYKVGDTVGTIYLPEIQDVSKWLSLLYVASGAGGGLPQYGPYYTYSAYKNDIVRDFRNGSITSDHMLFFYTEGDGFHIHIINRKNGLLPVGYKQHWAITTPESKAEFFGDKWAGNTWQGKAGIFVMDSEISLKFKNNPETYNPALFT